MGLWLLQECRRAWARSGRDYSYEELGRLAENADPFGPLVAPDHPAFLPPGDMPSRIRRFWAVTRQGSSDDPGVMARCVLESLALKYDQVLQRAAKIAGLTVDAIHVVGGGSRNAALCQLTADATCRPVLAGPVEATALGNVMVQAFAGGHVGSLEEMRTVVRRSVAVKVYEPSSDPNEWGEVRERFSKICEDALILNESGGK